jgi:hypothetical protein
MGEQGNGIGLSKISRMPKIHGEDERKSKLKDEDRILNENGRDRVLRGEISFVIATIRNSQRALN